MPERNGFDIFCAVADKGCDFEHVHESIHACWGGCDDTGQNHSITFKGKNPKAPTGKTRKAIFRDFPKERYNRDDLSRQ